MQITAAAAEKTRQERQGLDFEGVPDADLFFVDKGEALARRLKVRAAAPVYDLWGDDSKAVSRKVAKRATQRGQHPAPAKAVEVDGPGCSFNPDPEAQQEAIGAAVAAELKKVYQQDALPVGPSKRVDYVVEEDELEQLQVDEAASEDEEEQEEEGGTSGPGVGPVKLKRKKTQVDRNRAVRRKEMEAVQAAARAVKSQRAALSNLPKLLGEIQEEEEELALRRQRREMDIAESSVGLPPRLGKTRFDPMPMQLLTSDEVTGSLRKLRPTASLAKDRFKSLQQRGIIEPRKAANRKGRKRVEFIRGEKGEKEREGHAAILAARRKGRGPA